MSAPTHPSRAAGVLAGLVTALAVGALTFLLLADSAGGAAALLGRTGPGSAVPGAALGVWEVRSDEFGGMEEALVLRIDRAAFAKVAERTGRAEGDFLPAQAVIMDEEGDEFHLVNIQLASDGYTLLLFGEDLGVGVALQPDPAKAGAWQPVTSAAPRFTLTRKGAAPPPPAPPSERELVTYNLRMIASGAQQYMLDQGVTQVSSRQFIGTNTDSYIRPLTPVRGERYDAFVITQTDSQIYIEVPGVGRVTYEY